MSIEEYKSIYVCTNSGKKVYFLDLKPDMICIEDIAHSLSNICRFNGHSSYFYSIAQHSMMVADMVDDSLKIYALMHDAAEAYMSDMSRPLKLILNHFSDDTYGRIEKDILHCINEKLGLRNLTDDEKRSIKLADNTALYIESHHFFVPEMLDGWRYGELINPIPSIRVCGTVRSQEDVRNDFIYRYGKYRNLKGKENFDEGKGSKKNLC